MYFVNFTCNTASCTNRDATRHHRRHVTVNASRHYASVVTVFVSWLHWLGKLAACCKLTTVHIYPYWWWFSALTETSMLSVSLASFTWPLFLPLPVGFLA